MDTARFDTGLTTSGTRRQALRSLAGLAGALAVAGILGADEGEAKKKRKKGKGKKGKGKGSKGGGANTGGQGGGGSTGGNGNGNGGGTGNGGNGGGSNTTQTEEEKLLGLVNDFRAQSGQPALGRGDKQDTAGSNHSREMANREFFSHTTPVGGTPDQRMAVAGDSYRWWGKYIG